MRQNPVHRSILLVLLLLCCLVSVSASAQEDLTDRITIVEASNRRSLYGSTVINKMSLSAPESYEKPPTRSMQLDSAEAVAEHLLIDLNAPTALPEGYDPDACSYTLYMTSLYPDHVRLAYSSNDPEQPAIYMLIEYIGPTARLEIRTAADVEKVELGDVEAALIDGAAIDAAACYMLWIDGPLLYRLTSPSPDPQVAIAIAQSVYAGQ